VFPVRRPGKESTGQPPTHNDRSCNKAGAGCKERDARFRISSAQANKNRRIARRFFGKIRPRAANTFLNKRRGAGQRPTDDSGRDCNRSAAIVSKTARSLPSFV